MNKTERDELRRLMRARFKLLRADVAARQQELENELEKQIADQFADLDKCYDEAMYKVTLALDEANRQVNDIGRELYGAEKWGLKHDRRMVSLIDTLPKPGTRERGDALRRGRLEIEERVKKALLELDRSEIGLLTELATSALESAEAREFFNRLPSASELVPAYRLQELTR